MTAILRKQLCQPELSAMMIKHYQYSCSIRQRHVQRAKAAITTIDYHYLTLALDKKPAEFHHALQVKNPGPEISCALESMSFICSGLRPANLQSPQFQSHKRTRCIYVHETCAFVGLPFTRHGNCSAGQDAVENGHYRRASQGCIRGLRHRRTDAVFHWPSKASNVTPPGPCC